MNVVIAEKPSVARELAAFLGANRKHSGYLEGNDYCVTWAFGHLVTLQEPEDYDPALKRWQLESLPFVPERFRLKLNQQQGVREQFETIVRLFSEANEIVCATDAGREGELIFRYILSLSGYERPFKRLWLSSLTRDAIAQAFKTLKPGSHYDALYAAARSRSEADWIVGLNATRYYTVQYRPTGSLWSVGRVQTPVLALIVQRDEQIRCFVSEPYWELKTLYRKVEFTCKAGRFPQQAAAKQLLASVIDHPLVITGLDKKSERELPPLLFDLTALQREMNRRYGLSADRTLQAAQALYEQKLLTYPRTDARHLSTDMKEQTVETLRSLTQYNTAAVAPLDLERLTFSSRIFDDKKVNDHHAIVPTGRLPDGLPPEQQQIFDAVAIRLIAAFYPACEKEITTVTGEANRVTFQVKGTVVLVPGWTALESGEERTTKGDKEDEAKNKTLPVFTLGESGPHAPFLKEGKTSPPQPYNENTLLSAMESAGRLVDDEALKEALKEKGLGTPATRAAIIETLLKRGYIERRKKALNATDKGRFLISAIGDELLKSPELTGEWEAKLKRIEAGALDDHTFMREIEAYTQHLIANGMRQLQDASALGSCPRCNKPVIEGHKGYGCSAWREGCKFVLWKTYKDLELDAQKVRVLLQRRMLPQPISIEGKTPVLLCLSSSGEILEIAPVERNPRSSDKAAKRKTLNGAGSKSTRPKMNKPKSYGKCPLCGQPVIERTKGYSCSALQEGCSFTIWKTIAGREMKKKEVQLLLKDGYTDFLQGFTSKAGKRFDACLQFIDGKVGFTFQRPEKYRKNKKQ